MEKCEIIIVGAGHAGIEAALAAARMGCKAIMLTLNAENIGLMSCNPAIGGVGKGQLVKEIDALGGEMGRAADACGIQFRILNASKGTAVQSSRAQIDMYKYNEYMINLVSKNVKVKEAEVKKLIVEKGKIRGVITNKSEEITAEAVVICPGTFLDGLIHIGLKHHPGGRINEPAAEGLGGSLKELGLKLMRFKTGTCARLDNKSIGYSKLKIQQGDNPPKPFSFWTQKLTQKQIPCHITYTNEKTHKIIRDNLDRSPLYAGVMKSTGVRYCPSIEDKVVKFPDRARHQIFLEPQGLDTNEVYPNGISTSLPEDAQAELIHSMEGLERAKILRFGYGIEHTVIDSTQLYPTMESKSVGNLYLAGQVNGTTGYEEAAAQGLIAGINAALKIKKKEPLILDRASSYIGVLLDDLTTKGTNEPYRMFTSRVEYRLILREDNADLRLSKYGYELGLLSKVGYKKVKDKAEGIVKGLEFLRKIRVKEFQGEPLKRAATLEDLLKRPRINIEDLGIKDSLVIPESVSKQIEIEVKYAGFIQRQLKDVGRFKNLEKIRLPQDMDYTKIPSLSREIKEKLQSMRPINLGQASRISGVTPAAISLLMVYLRKINNE